MKLGPIHEDRIESLEYYTDLLSETTGDMTAEAIISKMQEIGHLLVASAPDNADPGRITHALDCLRDALCAFDSAVDIGNAKTKRMRREEAASTKE